MSEFLQTISTACMFLASKVEDTPCYIDKVVKVAYEMMYRGNPAAAQRIQQKVLPYNPCNHVVFEHFPSS